jgi:hypothetical protein
MGARIRRPTAIELYAAIQAALLLAALTAVGLTSTLEDWRPLWAVVMLGALAAAADVFEIRLGHVRLSGSFIALVLAMVVLGPARGSRG